MKKYISIMVSAAVCFSSLPFCANAFSYVEENNDRWDGTSDTSWYNESEASFRITTAEQLAGLAELVNGGNSFEGKMISLEADIYINDYVWEDIEGSGISQSVLSDSIWMPIGEQQPFCGTFNGNGYMVHGLKTENCENSGLFGMLDSAVIKNVILEEGTVNGTVNSGGICGYAVDTQFINCTNGAEISAYSEGNSVYAGGIAGFAEDSVFDNCSNYAIIKPESVSGESYAGGISGNGLDSEFTVCENRGFVLADSESGNAHSGGICGFGAKSADGCMNESLVAAASTEAIGYSGGIIGLGKGSEGCTDISRCLNGSTALLSKSSGGYAGGICGLCGIITDCVNLGIVGAVQGNSQYRIGGIAGGMADITNCIGIGNIIEDSGTEGNTDVVSGGIIADAFGSNIVNSFYLDTSAECASESDEALTFSVTQEVLASEEFVKSMGENYILTDEGYPVPVCCYTTVMGDTSADGAIDSMDMVIIRRGITEGFDTVAQRKSADVTENNIKNSDDLAYVRDYLLGEREDFEEDFGFVSVGSNNIFT